MIFSNQNYVACLVLQYPMMSQTSNTKRKLFVRNLSFSTNAAQLRSYCEQFGPVEYVQIAVDTIRKGSRQGVKCYEHMSKGYGFVTFRDDLGAWNALNDTSPHVDGRPIQMFLASTRSTKMFENAEEEVMWLLTL